MNLLIDTNIVIPLEPSSIDDLSVNTDLAIEFHNLCNRSGNTVCVHPSIYEDLKRDENIQRAELRKTLIKRYHMLDSPPDINLLEKELVGSPEMGSNDWVDNCFLAAIKADAVDFFITEDKAIHKKANRLNIASQVLKLNDAIQMLQDLFDTIPAAPPLVSTVPAYTMNLNDPIFNSLREDYPDFDRWFTQKCKRQQRTAYVIKQTDDSNIAGIAILKQENEIPNGPKGKTLKLCTFKISNEHGGNRYGELLLRTIFDYATGNNYDQIYFTAFEKRQDIIDFSRSFGFENHDNNTELGENILYKKLKYKDSDIINCNPLLFNIKYGPKVVSFNNNNSFIVPILPEYHRILFPDIEQQQSMFPPNRPCGNSIKKAYICNASLNKIKSGDNLFFYRSKDTSGITAIGIVEESIRSKSADSIAKYVGTRTVYRFSEIKQLCMKRPVLAIKFRYIQGILPIISLQNLRENSILNGQPQSITQIDSKGIEWLKNQIKK